MKADGHSMPADGDICKVLDTDNSEPTKATVTIAIVRAAAERRRAALREYMLALASSVTVGEEMQGVQHDHRQFYICGLDLIGRASL